MFHAVLAGAGLDRLVVQMPAWRIVGIQGWATYSRHADLGHGLLLYPIAAIGGFVLSLSAVITARRQNASGLRTTIPFDAAAALAAVTT